MKIIGEQGNILDLQTLYKYLVFLEPNKETFKVKPFSYLGSTGRVFFF